MNLPYRLLTLAAFACGCAGFSGANAAVPDIVGFSPGMSAEEAYRLLQKYAGPSRKIQVGRRNFPDLSPKPIIYELQVNDGDTTVYAEVLQLEFTLPPEPQTLWRVVRRLHFQPGKEMLAQNVVTLLRGKYGAEAQQLMTPTVPGMWWFMPDGRRASVPPGLQFADCSSIGPQPAVDIGVGTSDIPHIDFLQAIQRREPRLEQCRELVKVSAALLTLPGTDLVVAFTVEVADLGLEAHAHDASVEQIARGDKNRQQQVLDHAAQQEKPKL
jgi:hypothetical protein